MKRLLLIVAIISIVGLAFLFLQSPEGGQADMRVRFYDKNGNEVATNPLLAFYIDGIQVSTYDIEYGWSATLSDVDASTVSSTTSIQIQVACSDWTGYTSVATKQKSHSQVVKVDGSFTGFDIKDQLGAAYNANNMDWADSTATSWTVRLILTVTVSGTDSRSEPVDGDLEKTAEFTISWEDGDISLTGYIGETA